MKKISLLLVVVLLFSAVSLVGCKKQNQSTSYDIECSFLEDTLSANEKVCFYNDSENVFSQLKFNLFMNAYREGAKYKPIADKDQKISYKNGIDYGYTIIESVKSGVADLPFEIGGEDENILIVTLSESVFPKESVEIEISFSVKLANNISRTGINDDSINLGNFYPILCAVIDGNFYECVYYSNGDPFCSDVANYNVTLSICDEYIVASSGQMVSSYNENGKNINHYEIFNARNFCFVFSKQFESIIDNSLGIEITYYFFKDDNPQKSLKVAVDSIKTFNEMFGQYPYKTFSVVETPFNQGGMEYTALVYISSELEKEAYEEVIIHETAHQWWQTVVGNNEIEHAFLDEGLAEYSVVLFYEKNSSYNRTRENLIKSCEGTYRIFCSVFDRLYGNVDTSMNRSLDEYKSEYEYVNIAYIKGCLMHEYLRSSIGDEKYFSGLKKYYNEYFNKIATPEDLMGVYEKIGCDTNGFFNSFLDGSVIL